MAGFQKFRVPRRLYGSYWMINKNFRLNTLSVLWSSLCFTILTYRQLRPSIGVNPPKGQYIDPDSEYAPRLISAEAQ